MEGRKVPWTNARAIAYLRFNEPSNTIERRKVKRQARREDRRYQKISLAQSIKP
jgi:hypothetical protein